MESPGPPSKEPMSAPHPRIGNPRDHDFETRLRAAKHGAEWAWAAIYRDLAGVVSGYLANRGAAEPEDLTSETFLQIARNISTFEGDESAFRSWVFVIAHRRLIDSRRARQRRPETVNLSVPAGGAGRKRRGRGAESINHGRAPIGLREALGKPTRCPRSPDHRPANARGNSFCPGKAGWRRQGCPKKGPPRSQRAS